MSIPVAHRGLAENQLSGFITAYAAGFQVCECDIHETRDHELVVCHDDCAPGMTVPIKASLYADVKIHIPSLKSVVATVPASSQLLIELKPSSFSNIAWENLRDMIGHQSSQFIFISFHLGVLIEVKKILPSFKTIYLTESMNPSQDAYVNSVAALYQRAVIVKALGIAGVGFQSDRLMLTKEEVASLHTEGLMLQAWYGAHADKRPYTQVEEAAMLASLTHLDVDYINVDYLIA